MRHSGSGSGIVTDQIESNTDDLESILQQIEDDLSIASNNYYQEATAVPPATPTVVLSYTVPIGEINRLRILDVGGTNVATFDIKIDGITQAKKYTHFCNLNESINFENLNLTAGQALTVTVEHERPFTGDFSSRLLYGVV